MGGNWVGAATATAEERSGLKGVVGIGTSEASVVTASCVGCGAVARGLRY